MYRNELYHFGVKGMRWGVRKDRSSGGMSRRQTKKAINGRIRAIKKAQRKRYAETDISKLSDAELRNLNNRIQQENTYASSMKTESSIGKKFAESILNGSSSVAGTLVKATLASAASVAGAMAIEKMFKDKAWMKDLKEDFKKWMKPKK